MEIRVGLPLDTDGFLRRECPTCEREFKWFHHEQSDPDAEIATQYFCPLCGVAAGLNAWWTQTQIAYARGQAGPSLDQMMQDTIASAFKSAKSIKFEVNKNFSLGLDAPSTPEEPNDMTIVVPPCHSNEPLKVPESATNLLHCLICGSEFTA